MKFYKLSWQELQADCYKLAKKLKKQKFDRILCISRGGLVWARMFSDLLNLPVSHLTVVSYQDLKQQKETKITEVPATLENQNMLVVDEIADTGVSLKGISDAVIDKYQPNKQFQKAMLEFRQEELLFQL